MWTMQQLHWPIEDSSAFNFAPARADGLGDYWVSGGLQMEAIRADISLHRCCYWEVGAEEV